MIRQTFDIFVAQGKMQDKHMARAPKKAEPQSANLSLQQMELAIPKLDRRIADLDALWGVTSLDTASDNMFHGTPLAEVRDGLRQGMAAAKAHLETIKAGFLEELGDAGHTGTAKTLKAYEGLELHAAIERAAGKLFHDGHYANAVEDAVKALNALVRLNSGVDDKDGSSLMEHAFSPKNPILKFNSLADASDLDEQRGFMMMFSGSVAGLRNPRAHKIIKDDPEKALEFIAFVSLLAKLADQAKK